MTWQQIYDPFGNKRAFDSGIGSTSTDPFLRAGGIKETIPVSALSGLVMAIALALLVFKMPTVLVTTAAGHGFIFGLVRIAWARSSV